MATINKLPLLGLVALLAACGGGGDNQAASTTTDTASAAVAPAVAPAAAPAPAPTGNVIEVHMVTTPDGASGRFEPANVTAKKGDTVRFITDGKTMHNVSFLPPSENANKTGLPTAPGTMLTMPNQNFDVVVTMDPGTYNFHCDPHFAMGMKGVLTVQ